MERQKTFRGQNSFLVIVGLVVGIGRHQLGPPGPFGIGVLALNFIEICRCEWIVFPVQLGFSLVIKHSHFTGDVPFLTLFAGTAGDKNSNQNQGNNCYRTSFEHDFSNSLLYVAIM